MRYVIAFDFEAAGGIPAKHGFTQLGAVLFDTVERKVLISFNEYASMDGFEWDERCVTEFWSKSEMKAHYEETLRRTATAKPPREVAFRFYHWIRAVTAGAQADTVLISDNVYFDGGILAYFCPKEILYVFGEYRDIIDTGSWFRGMSRKRMTYGLLDQSSIKVAWWSLGTTGVSEEDYADVKHDHNPVNDAHRLALTWSFIQKHLEE